MHLSDRLFRAVRRGDLKTVAMVIKKGAKVDSEDEDGYTPLMNACYDGYLDIVQLLLVNGANPNHWAQGDNPLMRAAAGGKREVYEYLLPLVSEEIRSSTDERELARNEKRLNREEDTVVEEFIDAAQTGDIDSVSDALDAGMDVNAIGSNGHTALHYAAFYGHLPVVELLIESGADVNIPAEEGSSLDDAGTTAVGLVASSFFAADQAAVIKTLAAAGAELDVRNANGMTALIRAIERQFSYPNSVKALVEAGADLEIKDREGNSALMLAAWINKEDPAKTVQNKQEIAAILRSAGASEQGLDEICLIHASRYGDLETVRKLLLKPDLNINHSHNGSALFKASMYGHTEIVRTLVEAGADVNQKDDGAGFCPLIHAAYGGLLEVTRLLVNAGADLTAEVPGMGTALDYARLGKFERGTGISWDEIIQLLESAGTPSSRK